MSKSKIAGLYAAAVAAPVILYGAAQNLLSKGLDNLTSYTSKLANDPTTSFFIGTDHLERIVGMAIAGTGAMIGSAKTGKPLNEISAISAGVGTIVASGKHVVRYGSEKCSYWAGEALTDMVQDVGSVAVPTCLATWAGITLHNKAKAAKKKAASRKRAAKKRTSKRSTP